MAKFAQLTAKARKAPRVVMVSPDEYCSTYERIPEAPIAVGIRRLADADETIAIAGAETTAKDLYDAEGSEAYETIRADALLRHVVVAAICDPNDVNRSHPKFPQREETLRLALTSAALRRLFDEVERVTIETSPLYPETTDEEVGDLAARLMVGADLRGLELSKQNRARRYLRFALDEIRGEEDDAEELDLTFLQQ